MHTTLYKVATKKCFIQAYKLTAGGGANFFCETNGDDDEKSS